MYDKNDIDKAKIILEEENITARKQQIMGNPKKTNFLTLNDFKTLVETQKEKKFMILQQQILDVTKFTNEHPGGSRLIQLYHGKDATKAFYGHLNNHTKSARMLVDKLTMGQLVEKENLKDLVIAPAAEEETIKKFV